MRARAHVHKWRPYSTYSTARRPLYAASPFPSLLLRKAPSLWWAVLFPLEGWSVLHCSDEDSGCDEHGWNVDMHSVTPKALTLCYHLLGHTIPSLLASVSQWRRRYLYLYFVAGVKCQHYLCDWHKDISFKSGNCSEPSSAAHPVIVEYFVCVRGTRFSCIGSYCPPLMHLAAQVFCWVKLSVCLR